MLLRDKMKHHVSAHQNGEVKTHRMPLIPGIINPVAAAKSNGRCALSGQVANIPTATAVPRKNAMRLEYPSPLPVRH